MSYQVVLSQNKILAYFSLDSSANIQQNTLLQPSAYTTFIFHNHYPVIYYQQLYNHFQYCLPQNCQPGHIRIYFNKKQLPSEVPMGLFVTDKLESFTVGIDLTVCIPDAFRVIKNSWKKAFEVINSNRRCDYVKTRLSEKQLKQKFKLYCEGVSHNLQNQGLYQGNNMIVKGFYDGEIIERKYAIADYPTMETIVQNLFSLGELRQQFLEADKTKKIRIISHGIQIDLSMSSKIFLDRLSYNDGYCYLKLQVQ